MLESSYINSFVEHFFKKFHHYRVDSKGYLNVLHDPHYMSSLFFNTIQKKSSFLYISVFTKGKNMAFSPGANLYGIGVGYHPENIEVPFYSNRNPLSSDTANGFFPVGKWWVNIGNSLWYLLSFTATSTGTTANWVEITTSAGSILSVLGTTNQITATTSAGVVTLTIPATFIAPGSIAATTSLTATLGNITATNGNFVASTAGTGLVLTPVTASGTTTATANGRSGVVTITTPSIAAGAVFTMTITNTSVTGSGTDILYSLVGGTTGAALSIQSVTNSANTSAVVINNGTGATTNTGSLQLFFLVLN
jgi:hypothetical protein